MTSRIRFRVDFDGPCSVGFGKIELLEAIARTGSLSQAARSIEMSYRRAWLLVDSMNTGFTEPVVRSSTGGSGGGGAALTEFGQQLVSTFRELQPRFDALAGKHMHDIARRVLPASKTRRTRAKPPAVPRRSLSRNARAAAAK